MSGAPVLRSYQVEDLHRVEAEIAAGRRRVLLTEVCGGGKTVTAVSNAMVLTEGFDLPELGCIVLSRPTRHVGLFRQMLGRGLQPAPGKTDCLVLDHSGAVFTHGFIEDAVNWTLDVDGRAENRAHKARAEHR